MTTMNKKINVYFFSISIHTIDYLLKISATVLIVLFILNCNFIIKNDSNGYSVWAKLILLSNFIKNHSLFYFPYFILFLSIGIYRYYLKFLRFDESVSVEETSGNFGTARYANQRELKMLNAHDPKNGPFIGVFENQSLYLPMYNKLTISPPGGGKTTSSSIPILLTHEGPVFVF